MKVTTDGCLFGAVVAAYFSGIDKSNVVLDIGTGTGLLSLMLAQQNPLVKIDAIEIDANAAAQAEENVAASNWSNTIQVVHSSIQAFNPAYKYDIIISNPPFYENQLVSKNGSKNEAHHSASLSLQELFSCVHALLKTEGIFVILMPFYREVETIKTAAAFNLYPFQMVNLKQSSKHHFFRSIIFFQRKTAMEIDRNELIIKDEKGHYTTGFRALLSEYYLNL